MLLLQAPIQSPDGSVVVPKSAQTVELRPKNLFRKFRTLVGISNLVSMFALPPLLVHLCTCLATH